ncbi:MAG: N-formylglutamate amidohydrolase [Paracoccaceae bacterium]
MPLEVVQGKSALILAMPYTGTNMQPALVDRLIHKDRWLTAPDRSLDRLLGGLFEDVSLVRANFHRYLSDADVPSPKYARKPLQGMIGTVPVLDRSGLAIWTHPPSEQEAMGWHSM